ncbi:50S ribosomal protein L6 [Geodia barretti]|uniref:Large ribosomal subunit protein uL6 n=1 Tax=Geodia barretti TaxID=519541 RepID=A0AA35RKA5_GEOBA|nr:50S ribosomal protein L6 [Geodia barretti]
MWSGGHTSERYRVPRGNLTQNYHPEVKVPVEDGNVLVERISERKFHHSLHGLTRSLIANAIVGVTDGYTKTLELMGVGYRVQQSGEGIVLNVGFSHPVEIQPPRGVTWRLGSPQPCPWYRHASKVGECSSGRKCAPAQCRNTEKGFGIREKFSISSPQSAASTRPNRSATRRIYGVLIGNAQRQRKKPDNKWTYGTAGTQEVSGNPDPA